MSGNPSAVVGPNFCVPYPIEFTIIGKVFEFGQGNNDVLDADGNIMFRVEGVPFSFHSRRVIRDSTGAPIITLRHKRLTSHRRWQAFRGESTEEKDLIFEAKTSSYIQYSTKLHVFLANNTSNEQVPDYTVKGAWGGKSCEIYAGNSSTLLAQMEKKFKFIGNDKFSVIMYPHVDSAFIVSLIVIFDEIRRAKKRAAQSHHHHK